MEDKNKISACLVVYNEEKVIERCLISIQGLADEIILVHDGECTDKTIEIARKYTDKIFIRPHIGMMEGHLVFAFEHAAHDWILRIDADEFIDENDFEKIKDKISDDSINALILRWEMWNGKKAVHFNGLQKMCFFRKNHYHYCGIPHEGGTVDGTVETADALLHHQPQYDNISWHSFFRKKKGWVQVHAKYFFPELVSFECFNGSPEKWWRQVEKIKKNMFISMIVLPWKMMLGQLKNGLWKSWHGINIACQQYVYYSALYYKVWQMNKKLKSP
jgi:glycosyltransferase involved in cell wall biosynthesis